MNWFKFENFQIIIFYILIFEFKKKYVYYFIGQIFLLFLFDVFIFILLEVGLESQWFREVVLQYVVMNIFLWIILNI